MIRRYVVGDYVIVGDTERYKDCLVCIGGAYENAEKALNRMLNNPTENDRKLMTGHTNFRIKYVSVKDCWWHGNCD